MAKGFKTGGRDFKKGDPSIPKSPGRPPISQEQKELMKFGKEELLKHLIKYATMPVAEMREIERKLKSDNEAMDHLSLVEMGIMRSFRDFARSGNVEFIHFWIDHLIGKVAQAHELSGPGGKPIETKDLSDLKDFSKSDLYKLLEKIPETAGPGTAP